MTTIDVGHIMLYFVVIMYLVFVSGRMLPLTIANKKQMPDGVVARKVQYAAAVLLFEWALTLALYFPMLLIEMSPATKFLVGGIVWYIIILAILPSTFWSLKAFTQCTSRSTRWLPWAVVPESFCLVCFIARPDHTIFLVSIGIYVLTIIAGTVSIRRHYHRYHKFLKAEYSDISRHELSWVFYVYVAVLMQCVTFVFCTFDNNVMLSYIYMAVLVACSFIIIKRVRNMHPLDIEHICHEMSDEAKAAELADVPTDDPCADKPADEQDAAPDDAPTTSQGDAATDESAPAPAQPAAPGNNIHELIRQKLKTVCEDGRLFLDPELTRESLSAAIKVNRTYLSRYFHEEDTTYYHYINTLRVEYAVRLIKEEPDLSLLDICLRSGFSNTSTFRRSFRSVKGCLPSDFPK